MEKQPLSEAWADLNTKIRETLIFQPHDITNIAGALLRTMMLISDEKIRLVALLKTVPCDQAEYEKQTKRFISQGMAQNEREMMRHLAVPKKLFETSKRVEVLNEMMESCRRYESILKVIQAAMQVEAKLSYEGH